MRRLLTLLAALTFVGAACSSSAGLDLGKLEQELAAGVRAAFSETTVNIDRVTCPRSDPAPTAGDSFTCQAVSGDKSARVEVHLTEDGDAEYRTIDLLYDLASIEETISTAMSTELEDTITVDCDSPGLLVLTTGDQFDCEAKDSAGNRATVRLTANGLTDVSWELLY